MGSLPAVGRGMAMINWSKLWRATKVLGIGAVATAMQMEVGELAAHLIAHQPKRRRKGISARQLSNARRVNRIVCNWHKQLTSTAKTRRC